MSKKIRGLEIKEHIPIEILSMVEQSGKEAGFEWNDQFIKECCLTAPPSNYNYCTY